MPLIERMGVAGGVTLNLKHDIGFREGVYMYKGILTNQAVADKFGMSGYVDETQALARLSFAVSKPKVDRQTSLLLFLKSICVDAS